MNRLLVLKQQLIVTKDQTFSQLRAQSTIDKLEFNKAVYGNNFEERLKAISFVKQNPAIFQHFHLTEATRDHQREVTTKQVLKLKQELNIGEYSKSNPNKLTLFGNGLTFYDLNLTTKLGVHYSLYLKTIQRLGTEKHNVFYERACKFKDIGCFALTQLMHGSNVRGLLTQAHYDHSSKSFYIHSPSRDAMKFWIGGAAKTSNMCIVWAQLYIGVKCYGVHAFIVPIRCPDTHKVLPGITIGDCGPKFGLNAIDNGFILFQKFQIPKDNLLDKVSGINGDGAFFSTVEGQGKRFGMTLAALSQGRLFMCCHSTSLGISALTIALRYSFVRRQFSSKIGGKQTLLIDYPLTKRRMIPLLAQEIIYMCATMKTFEQSENNSQKNNLLPTNPLLQQIHAISSVLKSKTAWIATQTIRQCRQMMGGHGFSAYSKMGALYSNNDVNNTWQGENHVLLQQTTKYVLQNYAKAMKGKSIKSPLLKFLADPPSQQKLEISQQFLLNFDKIGNHLKRKIIGKCQEMGIKMMDLKQKQIPSSDIWNESQAFLGQSIAMNAGDLYILNSCLARMSQIKDPQSKKVFEDILHLWTLTIIRNDEHISEQHHGQIQKIILVISQKLVPQILGILESISADDAVLGSPFADESGLGFQKYMEIVLAQPKKQRPDYWRLMAER